MNHPSLFDIGPAPAKAPVAPLAGRGIPLRFYQREDADALMYALESGHKRPACVGATGSGKSATIAEISGRLMPSGKVVALCDREHLVYQLADEIERHLDIEVGRVADGQCSGLTLPVVVSTVQAMFMPGRDDRPLYELPQLRGTRAVIADESHKFFAPCFRSVPEHFVNQCGAVVIGFTATPVASNGDRWRSFFDWTPEAPGPCMRTVGWCIDNGYLVPLRQSFVQIDLRLDELYGQLADTDDDATDDDPADTSPASMILNLLQDKGEQSAARFASGVKDCIGDRQALVFTPPRPRGNPMMPAKLLASWLNAAGMRADAVWGGRADKADVLARFQRGRPRALANCALLCLDSETEILTHRGWVGIDEMTDDHHVANWNSGRVYFERPARIIRRQRAIGERMVSVNGERFNARVTEGHRMLYRSFRVGSFLKKPALELVGKRYQVPVSGLAEPFPLAATQPTPIEHKRKLAMIRGNTFTLVQRGMSRTDARLEAENRHQQRHSLSYKDPDEITLDECRLIGFWIGDGTATRLSGGGIEYTITQSIAYPKIIDWFDGVLKATGIHYIKRMRAASETGKPNSKSTVRWSLPRGTGFGCQARRGLFELEPYLKKDGTSLFWGLNQEQFDALIEGYWMADGFHGDGTTPRSSRQLTICGISLKLFDLLQAIATVREYRCSIVPIRVDPKWKQQYRLSLRKSDSFNLAWDLFEIEPDWKSERVWCVETSSHNIITRRRGRVLVMGNCEGFNAPAASAVFICRLVRSWRLVTQMIGRAMRPVPECIVALNELDDPGESAARRAVIAGSGKPDALIADLVGLDGQVLRASAIDVLNADESQDVRDEMARQAFAVRKSRPEDDAPAVDEDARDAAKRELAKRQSEQLAEMARRRAMAGALPVDVRVYDHGTGEPMPSVPAPRQLATLGERARFVAVAVAAKGYEPERARRIADTYPKNQLRGMTWGMQKKLDKERLRPDWSTARRTYPEWAPERKGAA